MATTSSPPQAASPPHSPNPSNSENSPTEPQPSMPPKVDEGAGENGDANVGEEKPDISNLHILDNAEYLEKFKKYEADYTHRLMAKYFSKKNLYGGNIFDETITVDGETIMSSRWPCTRSFADPVKSFEELNSNGSTSTSET